MYLYLNSGVSKKNTNHHVLKYIITTLIEHYLYYWFICDFQGGRIKSLGESLCKVLLHLLDTDKEINIKAVCQLLKVSDRHENVLLIYICILKWMEKKVGLGRNKIMELEMVAVCLSLDSWTNLKINKT